MTLDVASLPQQSGVPLRRHPHPDLSGPIDALVELEMVRLHRGLVAAQTNSNGMFIQFVGAARGVGTSTVVNRLAEVVGRHGNLAYSLDLSRSAYDLAALAALGDRAGASAYHPPPFPPEGPAPKLIASASSRIDFEGLVLLDTAPMHESALSIALASRARGVVLVVQANRTSHAQICQALERIQTSGGHCLGIVLNKTI